MVYEDEEPDVRDPNYDESAQVRECSRLSQVNMRILDYRLVMMAVERWEDMRGGRERVTLTPEATMVP